MDINEVNQIIGENDQLQTELNQLNAKNAELMQGISASNFGGLNDDNLIQQQLETDKILERIEHFLKGDEIKVKDGNVFYVTPKDPQQQNFNKYGVAELMRIISMYVTKETFLSYYEEDRINEIMQDIGDALTDFIYCNYEKIGMNTKYKETKYHLLVITILHTIESCYRRALNGNEQEHLRTRAIVTQNQPMGGSMMPRAPLVKKRFNPFDRSTW